MAFFFEDSSKSPNKTPTPGSKRARTSCEPSGSEPRPKRLYDLEKEKLLTLLEDDVLYFDQIIR